MGLFSGGGFLGKVGQAAGINSSEQEKAIRRAGNRQVAQAELGIEDIQGAQAATLGELQPFASAGLGALPSMESGATLEGFGGNIDDIFSSGILDSLIGERMRGAESAMGRAGLTRSGGAIQEAADIPTEMAFAIEQLLSGRQGSLAGIGQNAATNLASIRQGDAANMANLRGGIGQAQASSLLGQQQAEQEALSNTFSMISGGLSGAGNAGMFAGIGGPAAAAGGGAGLGGFLTALSDMRLKTNIVKEYEIGGLMVCSWDWVEGVEELLSEHDITLTNTGFIAQDVAEIYPQYSGDFHGFKTINYEGLINELSGDAH